MTRALILTALLSLAIGAVGRNVTMAEQCLRDTTMRVLTSGSPDFDVQKRPFNLRLSPSPSIIVFPLDEQHVQFTITCATDANLTVSSRSGGHSYAAYALEGDIVVDLSNLKGVTVSPDGTALVQTGNRLGDVATKIFNQGERALAHGSCPYVGSGGHTLYGGFGYFSRIAGLLLDQVVSARVVLADGRLVTASHFSNTDLFWAIRGGGPSFGLVTSWSFHTVPAPPTTVNYKITVGTLPVSQLVSAFLAWQSFATTAPKELAMAAKFVASGNRLSLSFGGNYYGTKSLFQSIIAPLMSSLPHGVSLSSQALGWIAGLEALADNNGTLNTTKPDIPDTFFAKSLVVNSPPSNASISQWINYMAIVGAASDTDWFAMADLYGGVISSVPTSATAFAQRKAFLVFQLYASSHDHMLPYPADGISFVDGMLESIERNPQGAYSNYIDPTLTKDDTDRLYWGSNVPRLQRIKAALDPNDVFRFSQGF